MSPSLVRAGVALVALAAMASHGDAQSARPGTAKARPSKQYTIEQFMNVTGVRGAGFSADEKRFLFSSNKTGICNVYSMPVGGGEPDAAHDVDGRLDLRGLRTSRRTIASSSRATRAATS